MNECSCCEKEGKCIGYKKNDLGECMFFSKKNDNYKLVEMPIDNKALMEKMNEIAGLLKSLVIKIDNKGW